MHTDNYSIVLVYGYLLVLSNIIIHLNKAGLGYSIY